MDFPFTLDFLNGLSVVGTWTLVGIALITGKGLALQREVKQRDETILWQRNTIEEKDNQIRDLIAGARVSVNAFQKVSDAAAGVASESGGA